MTVHWSVPRVVYFRRVGPAARHDLPAEGDHPAIAEPSRARIPAAEVHVGRPSPRPGNGSKATRRECRSRRQHVHRTTRAVPSASSACAERTSPVLTGMPLNVTVRRVPHFRGGVGQFPAVPHENVASGKQGRVHCDQRPVHDARPLPDDRRIAAMATVTVTASAVVELSPGRVLRP